MNKKEKANIITAWNELSEVDADFDLNNNDLHEVLPVMRERIQKAMDLLGQYFTDEEAEEHPAD